MLKKLAAAAVMAAIAVGVAACNTVEGAGKDVKAAGGAIEKAAEKTRTY